MTLELPLLEATAPSPRDEKPSWRGWVHAGTLPVAIVAGFALVIVADGLLARIACAIFALCSILLFGISALYHRFNWSPKVKVGLKRFDHANIFLLIAGTYTPISLIALEPVKGWTLFICVWSAALLGIAFRIFWINAPRWLYVALYIGLGWSALMFIVDLVQANWVMMLLVGIGGVLYTLGAVAYAMKKPNPWPGTFGFHEIFHVFTVLAFLSQWAGILLLVINPPVFA